MLPGKPGHVGEEARNLRWISPLPFPCRPEKAEEPAEGAPSPGGMQYLRGKGQGRGGAGGTGRWRGQAGPQPGLAEAR